MERLTEKGTNCEVVLKKCAESHCDQYADHCEDCKVYNEALKKLKDYEDAEEQGMLMRLPCKVGDKVYKIYDKIYEFKVVGIYLNEDRAVMLINCQELRIEISLDINEFNKVCFLAKEEAEAALERMG